MAENIEHVTQPLKAKGALKWSSAELYEEPAEIVITLKFSTPELATEVYETINYELGEDRYRFGSLMLLQEG